MSRHSLFKSLAAAALLVSVSGHAMAAVDAAKFAELLKAKLAGSNVMLNFEAAELSGSNVILKGASISFAGTSELARTGRHDLRDRQRAG